MLDVKNRNKKNSEHNSVHRSNSTPEASSVKNSPTTSSLREIIDSSAPVEEFSELYYERKENVKEFG